MKKERHNSFFIIICSIAFLFSSCQSPKQKSFHPGEVWLDSNDTAINAHGGGMLIYNDTYYWFGEHKTAGKTGNKAQVGVHCYSSKDLYNWKDEGIALPVSIEPGSDIEKGCIIERPKVIYNKNNNNFVMWFHLELKGKGYGAARTALAVSDKVTGPYMFVKSLRPNQKQWPVGYSDELKKQMYPPELKWWTPEWYKALVKGMFLQRDFEEGQMSRDMTLFVDDDGKAYHIHSSEDNLTLHISELTDDYQNFSGKYIRIFPGGHNEAPALFKKDDTYYLMTSGCTGWKPNAARMFRAKSIWGPWEKLSNPCVGNEANLTFRSQSTYIFPVIGRKNAFVYMGDRWTPQNAIDGRYVWLPILFENNSPVLKWKSEWNLNIFDSPEK